MKIYIKTYGCQMNERDSEAAAALLSAKGHSIVDSEAAAELVILNTCSVRDQAERKVIGKLGILKKLKRERPGLILGVMGCMAQSRGRELLDKIPHLDFAAGTDQLHSLPEIVEEISAGRSKIERTEYVGDSSMRGMDAHRMDLPESPVSAFISIMRGCDRFCSYCIVPYVRGRERSREPEGILGEAKSLVESGVKELTLLGQNVAAFGFDGRPPSMIPDNASPFAELLESLSRIDGLRRIRFTSPHPAFFNSRLIEAIASLPAVCKSVHLPLQSGSDSILKRMNRPYTSGRYMEIVERLKRLVPDITFSTDVIVGFPGETQEDFDATRSLMERVSYDNAFIFKYSPRKGTKAAELPDDVPQEAKEERNMILLKDLEERAGRRNLLHIGRTFEILVEGPSKRNAARWSGRTGTNRLAVFDPPSGIKPGDLIDVRISHATPMTLFGEPA